LETPANLNGKNNDRPQEGRKELRIKSSIAQLK
jgi:hypothetical protein